MEGNEVVVGVSGMSKRCRSCWLAVVLLLLVGVGAPVDARAAQGEHRAALVVDFGDGRVVVRLVVFAEDSISGVELLQRSGLDVALLPGFGNGTALCAVEGVGCAPTPQECFCQCRGKPCRYWSYFHLQQGAWVYAGTGAGSYRLKDGDVEGWVWGDGQTAPPLLTWEEILQQARPAEPTPVPPTPVPSATVLPPAATPPAPSPSAPPHATAASPTEGVSWPTPTSVDSPYLPSPAPGSISPSPVYGGGDRGGGEISSRPLPWATLGFGGTVLLLAGIWLWVRRRR